MSLLDQLNLYANIIRQKFTIHCPITGQLFKKRFYSLPRSSVAYFSDQTLCFPECWLDNEPYRIEIDLTKQQIECENEIKFLDIVLERDETKGIILKITDCTYRFSNDINLLLFSRWEQYKMVSCLVAKKFWIQSILDENCDTCNPKPSMAYFTDNETLCFPCCVLNCYYSNHMKRDVYRIEVDLKTLTFYCESLETDDTWISGSFNDNNNYDEIIEMDFTNCSFLEMKH